MPWLGAALHRGSILASHKATPDFFSLDVDEIYCFYGTAQKSGQRLDNGYQTNLELASGNLVLQKDKPTLNYDRGSEYTSKLWEPSDW